MPVSIAISVVPFIDIPAHMCTESGCFRFSFGMEGLPSRLNCFAKNGIISHTAVIGEYAVVKLLLCAVMCQCKEQFSDHII